MARVADIDPRHYGETDSLLPSRKSRRDVASIALDPLDLSQADIVMLLGYISTGILDSAATTIWGAFVSMQTGNSVYIGLGITDPTSSDRWIKSIVSVVAFCIGSFAFARFHRILGTERQNVRLLVASSFFVQLVLLLAASIVIHFTPLPSPGDKHDLHWHVMVPIALLAMQSAGQTACSRALKCGPVTSVVLTTIYCDLFSDANLFTGISANRPRNLKILAPILLVCGAIVGGLWSRSTFGLEGALWTAAVLKGLGMLAWIFWKPQEPEDDEDE